MKEFSHVGKRITRVDGEAKVTGSLKYMTDLTFPGMLYARILRSQYPHALIINMDFSKAFTINGVRYVLTAQDVPGLNGFGIVISDQPLLCSDKVRFLGDPIALIVAETEEAAAEALGLIDVEYEPLEVIDDPGKAMQDGTPLIHDSSNILKHTEAVVGDVEEAFKNAPVIVENTYSTTWQEHAFIETEGGIGVPTPDGGVTIYCPSQYGYRDRQQVAKMLNIDEDLIIIRSSPLGGGFGGKDDINVQGLLGLAALKTGRPVKIHLSREEAFVAGIKRQPSKISMRTAVSNDGKFIAQDVSVICDTGPYASLGVAIMEYGLQNICSAYYFPNVRIEGYCVYTNNPISGEFRGFGNNQMHFAVESQVDCIAKRLHMDPLKLRQMNCIKPGQRLSFGHLISSSVGAAESLRAAETCKLWKERESFKSKAVSPWIKRGVGIAVCQHGNGFGNARIDQCGAAVEIDEDGIFTVYTGCQEIGQGVTTTVTIIAAEELGVGLDKIKVVCGDTGLTPDSGPTTGSRNTYMVGNAVIAAAKTIKEKIIQAAADLLNASPEDVAFSEGIVRSGDNRLGLDVIGKRLKDMGLSKSYQSVIMPVTDIDFCIDLNYLQSYLTQVVGVEVNVLTGKVDAIVTEVFPDAGRVINRLGYEGQVEGGTVMGMGYALMEEFVASQGKNLTENLQTYLIPGAADIPEIFITPIEVLEESGPFGAKGLGETTSIAVTPAIINAIADAVDVRVRDLPATSERVFSLLRSKRDAKYGSCHD